MTGSSVHFDFLIDTNVFITAEPMYGNLEPNMGQVAQFLSMAAEHQHRVFRHPSTRLDIANDQDEVRRNQRLAELEKYPAIESAPIASNLKSLAGDSQPGTNDYIDLELLAALDAGAVTHLITQDIRLQKRAARAHLGARVLTIAEAVQLLRDLTPILPAPPPRVQDLKTYQINTDDVIFDSLRADYPEFDNWLKKVRQEHGSRVCFVITEQADSGYAALALLKPEPNSVTDHPAGPTLKISTFKVDSVHAGQRFGELLLKSIFLRAHELGSTSVYVEVFEGRQQLLVQLLSDFGFDLIDRRTVRGEAIYVKSLVPPPNAVHLPPLEYNRRFGPGAVRLHNAHLIPIQPKWHRQLFPEFESLAGPTQSSQYQLFDLGSLSNTKPWGNALRKAYLCKSNSKSLSPGSTLLFYRSRDYSAVTVIGVTEELFRTADPQELAFLIGKRTVYTASDIQEMTSRGRPVLAILFRQDRILEVPWSLPELEGHGVVQGWPQSITKVSTTGGREWVRDQLHA